MIDSLLGRQSPFCCVSAGSKRKTCFQIDNAMSGAVILAMFLVKGQAILMDMHSSNMQ